MITAAIDSLRTGQRISELLRARGISTARAVEELGLSTPNAIYKWMRGETLPTLDNLLLLSILLEVKIDEILIWQ